MTFNDKNDTVITKEEWMKNLEEFPIKQSNMNKIIMNYLVTEGFKEAAEKFRIEANLQPTIELSSLDDRILIREAVQNGRIQEATTLVNKLHPDLLESDRHLFFHLQQLHLIELIRTGNVEEALTYAQSNLSETGAAIPDVLGELERTLALLVFEKPQNSPFADLLDQSHRQKVASELNAAILKREHSADSTPNILFLLKLILWAQSKLDARDITYPKMKELETAFIEPK